MTSDDVERLIERDQIRLLLAIAEAGSFTAAATTLGITAASISQQVKRLEALAGCALFRRGNRGVELTAECDTVIFYARAMTELAKEMKQHFRQAAGSEKISIGMGEDFCRTALPAVLSLLERNFPHLDVRVISGSYDLLAQAIESRSVDIVIMRRWHRYPDTRVLWTDEQTWYGHSRFAASVPDPVPLVVPLAPNPTRLTLIEALKAQGRSWKIRFESVGMAGIEAALQCGLGLCGGPCCMPMYGVSAIGPESGLPTLPKLEFVMVGPSPTSSGTVRAVAEVLQHLATSGFRPARPPHDPRRPDLEPRVPGPDL